MYVQVFIHVISLEMISYFIGGKLSQSGQELKTTVPPSGHCCTESGSKGHHQRKGAELIFRMFWLHFCILGTSEAGRHIVHFYQCQRLELQLQTDASNV